MDSENQEPADVNKIEVKDDVSNLSTESSVVTGGEKNELDTTSSMEGGSAETNIDQSNPNFANSSNTASVSSETLSLDQAITSLPAENEQFPAGGVVSSDGSTSLISEPGQKAHKKRGWLWGLIVLVVVALALAWLFLIYLPGRPSAVYSSSLTNTGKALDAFINYAKGAQSDNFKNVAVTGSATVNGKNYNFTGGLDGSYNQDGNTTTTVNVDSATQGNTNSHVKATFDLRTLKDAGQAYPDIYLRAAGISGLLDELGVSQFDNYDGKWIEISHSFISKYASDATSQAESDHKQPTKDQIYDAVDKVQAVNKEYFFTPDSSKTVLVQKKFVGTETKYGRDTYHYLMGYNKDNLASYVKAVGQALDSSSLNDFWQQNYKKSISSQMNIDDAVKQINKLDGSYTFDMWADRDTKLIEALQFKDKNHPSNTVTIAQTYSGGHIYPFRVDIEGDQDGDKGSFTLEFTVDSDKHEVSASFNFNDDDHGNKTTAQGNLKFTESNNSTKVDRPAGSTPVEKILGIPVVGEPAQNSSASKAEPKDKTAVSPTLSNIQTKASYGKIQSDASNLLEKSIEYTMNNNGKQPKFAVQMGNTVQLCDNAGCTVTEPVSLKMASSDKVVVASSAPKAGDQIVLASGMKCDGSKLVKASSRSTAVSYYLGKTLTCQQS